MININVCSVHCYISKTIKICRYCYIAGYSRGTLSASITGYIMLEINKWKIFFNDSFLVDRFWANWYRTMDLISRFFIHVYFIELQTCGSLQFTDWCDCYAYYLRTATTKIYSKSSRTIYYVQPSHQLMQKFIVI